MPKLLQTRHVRPTNLRARGRCLCWQHSALTPWPHREHRGGKKSHTAPAAQRTPALEEAMEIFLFPRAAVKFTGGFQRRR